MSKINSYQSVISKHFRTMRNKGFHLKFDNGVILSTQFGPYNYCGTYPNNIDFHEKMDNKFDYESDDAEIGIFDKDRNWITKEYKNDGDDVLGFVSFDEWLKIIEWCKNYKAKGNS